LSLRSKTKASGWLQSAVTTTHVLPMVGIFCETSSILHRQVRYRALSLRYARIRCSSIILIPEATLVPNFVSVAPLLLS